MANTSLFASSAGRNLPGSNTRNRAGGRAYTLSPRHALAQIATTGCLNATFYASAEEQLDDVLRLAGEVEPEFLARLALYARDRAHMKDLPALVLAILSVRGPGLMAEVFDRVIDSPRMLRTFVQILRSGVVGRKSFGSLPKRMIVQWLERQTDAALFRASVGNAPSLADVIKIVHPRPATAARSALFAYLLGRPFDASALPDLVRRYEAFKAGRGDGATVPDVPMAMLTALPLSRTDWESIAANAPWTTTRMNLNTFARHGVFENPGLVSLVAERLRDPDGVRRSRVLPYQLMAAYTTAAAQVPAETRAALQDAMDVAVSNVPALEGHVWILPDISTSMQCPVTGHRGGATSAATCAEVAALVAAAFVRTCRHATVLPFHETFVDVRINPRDSVMSIAAQLAGLPSGGTNCSAPLAEIHRRQSATCRADVVIFVSDNESWIDTRPGGRNGSPTEVMRRWEMIRALNPDARLVCIDLTPNSTTQAVDRPDILNIGGFSDAVFDLITEFVNGRMSPDHWVGKIEALSI